MVTDNYISSSYCVSMLGIHIVFIEYCNLCVNRTDL